MLLSDREIRALCLPVPKGTDATMFHLLTAEKAGVLPANIGKPMIEPFNPELINKAEDGGPLISAGASSYGYDITLGSEVFVFSNARHGVLDPKRFDKRLFEKAEITIDPETNEQYVVIPANGFVLGHSVEWIRMPRNVTGIVMSKSTYARVGQVCICTPLEAGWEGQITLEFANLTPLPQKLYLFEGCAQVLFPCSEVPCETSYADRKGKYQNQRGVTLPRG